MNESNKLVLTRRSGKLAGIGLALVLSGSSMLNAGCTSPFISYEQRSSAIKQAETKPYAAFFEGLQPFSGTTMKEVGEQISRDIGIAACATSGNESAHMEIIREANKYHQPIIIVGFSMGEVAARNLAEMCEKEEIKVNCLILIDGVDLGVIHGNVRKVVDIIGTKPYELRRRGRYIGDNLENRSTIIKHYEVPREHLDIPGNSRSIIGREILESLGR